MTIKHQPVLTDEQAAWSKHMEVPQPCVHADLLDGYRRSIYRNWTTANVARCCPNCGQQVADNSRLQARDVPAIVHATVFYGVFFILYKLRPVNQFNSDTAMWIAWIAAFAADYKIRVPLSAARNAILIMFVVDTLMVYAHFWRGMMTLSFEATLLRAVYSFIVSLIAVTPIFASCGIRWLIDRLKDKGDAASFE